MTIVVPLIERTLMNLNHRTFRLAAAVVALAALTACNSDKSDTAATPAGVATYQAEIRYTQYGVPHIKADNFKGLGFGYGHAFAKDHLCLFSEEVVTLSGRRAEVFGVAPGKDWYLGQFGDVTSNVGSDFFYRRLFTDAVVEQLRATASQDLRDLVDGFVTGYNRFLADTPADQLPADCRGKSWVQPITERDMWLRFMQAGMAGSSMQFIDAIGGAQPPAALSQARARTAQPATRMASARQTRQDVAKALKSPLILATNTLHEHVIGSNGYGFGKDVTDSGKGIVMGNPHFPWWGALRLHQLHLTIPGKLDVMGATLLGAPVPLIGFNKDVAWTHTFTTDNRFTLFGLVINDANPTQYWHDGGWKDMTATSVTIQVKGADGNLTPLTRTLYSTVHGPLLSDKTMFAWSSTQAFAIRDANYTNYRLMDQALKNAQSTSAASLKDSLATWSAMPWVNTMAADKNGNTLYANYSVAANVTDAQLDLCVNNPVAQGVMAAQGIVIMDGTNPACQWDGAVPSKDRPARLGTRFVLNANDSHWRINDLNADDLVGFPKILATGPDAERSPLGERTRLGVAQVVDRLNNADGLGGNTMSVAKLQSIYVKSRVFKAERWLTTEFFGSVCAGSGPLLVNSVDIRPACGVLQAWKKTEAHDDAGALLFRKLFENLGELKSASYWKDPYVASNPVMTPDGFNATDAANVSKVQAALATTVKWMSDNQLALDTKNQSVQVVLRGATPIVFPGGRFSFNNNRGNFTKGTPLGNIYTDPVYGNSYMQFVTFDDQGPVAQGLLTYSQSSQTDSAHFADQTQVYSDVFLKGRAWPKLPFSDADIAADPAFKLIKISQ